MKLFGALWAAAVTLLPVFVKQALDTWLPWHSTAGEQSSKLPVADGLSQAREVNRKKFADKTMATLILDPINSFDEAKVIGSIDYFLRMGFLGIERLLNLAINEGYTLPMSIPDTHTRFS